MYVNENMVTVLTIPGMGGGEDEEWWGGGFKYDIFNTF
jgi:hypothetical protein